MCWKSILTQPLLANDTTMKAHIKSDFLIRTIANEKVLIGNGEQINFSKMLMLNDTAAFVIEELQKQAVPVDVETLAQCLADSYEVSLPEALADVKTLMTQLESQGVVMLE